MNSLSQVPQVCTSVCWYKHSNPLALIYDTGHSQIDLYARDVNGEGCLMEMLISFYKCFKLTQPLWQNSTSFSFPPTLPFLFARLSSLSGNLFHKLKHFPLMELGRGSLIKRIHF